MNKTYLNSLLMAAIFSTSLTACGFSTKLPGTGGSSNSSSSDSGGSNNSNSTSSTTFVASWEKSKASNRAWSDMVRDVVDSKATALYQGPSDVTDFCPMYDRLGREDRLNFWVEFTAGVAKYESGWKATSRYTESTMGTDPITGKQVVSEGLLQLSYQDVQWAKFCEFDWANDNRLYPSLSDARRSILDAQKNLSCGLQILNRQVVNKGKIALSSGVYWSTLKVGGTYTKLPEIKAMTNALSFCKK